MNTGPSRNFMRYSYVDADPRAEPGSPQRLRWEYVCAMMDAEEFRRRASLAGADGKMSERDRAQFMLMLSTAMGVSRALLAAVNGETLARHESAGNAKESPESLPDSYVTQVAVPGHSDGP